MSKQIIVTIPDSYFTENVIKRIENAFFADPNLQVVAAVPDNEIGDVLLAISDLQVKLKKLSQGGGNQ